MLVKPGDWVRYYSGGKLMLSEVAYVTEPDRYSGERRALTHDGAVELKHILEARSAAAEARRDG
jgi:hypothetical protein